MESLKFKTNINCGGCIAKVTPSLNKIAGEGNWQVDTTDRNKILTVKPDLPVAKVIASVKEAGFYIERIDS